MDLNSPTNFDYDNDTQEVNTSNWKHNLKHKWLSHWFWIILIVFAVLLIAVLIFTVLLPITSHHRDINIRAGNITGSVMRLDGMEPVQVSFAAPSGIYDDNTMSQAMNALNNRMVVGGNRFATASYSAATSTVNISIADGFGWVVLQSSTPLQDLGFTSGVSLFRSGYLGQQSRTTVEGCPIYDESFQ